MISTPPPPARGTCGFRRPLVRILLDTHIFLWAVSRNRRLSKKGRELIDVADEIYVSSVSIWEAAIKFAVGKLDINIPELAAHITLSGYVELPARVKHAVLVRDLPAIHRDPFDRMLIAQVHAESLALLTTDRQLAQYSALVQTI